MRLIKNYLSTNGLTALVVILAIGMIGMIIYAVIEKL